VVHNIGSKQVNDVTGSSATVMANKGNQLQTIQKIEIEQGVNEIELDGIA
jgi:hypothetical protein